MKKLIDKLLFTYGFLPMVTVIEKLEKEEDYETCVVIYNAIQELSLKIGWLIPTRYDEHAVGFMKANFNEFGLTGEITLLNNPYYAELVYSEINNFKTFEKLSVFNKSLKKGLGFSPKKAH